MQEKSSKIFENSKEGTIGARIKVLLAKTNKNVTELEELGGVGNGTLKSWKEKSIEFSSNVVTGFKRTLRINDTWWKTGEGEVFNTYVETPKEKMNNTNPNLEMIRMALEENTEYSIVPKTVLHGDYRMMLISEIEFNKKMLYEVIDAKNDLIKDLKEEISDLRSRLNIAAPAQNTQ